MFSTVYYTEHSGNCKRKYYDMRLVTCRYILLHTIGEKRGLPLSFKLFFSTAFFIFFPATTRTWIVWSYFSFRFDRCMSWSILHFKDLNICIITVIKYLSSTILDFGFRFTYLLRDIFTC